LPGGRQVVDTHSPLDSFEMHDAVNSNMNNNHAVSLGVVNRTPTESPTLDHLAEVAKLKTVDTYTTNHQGTTRYHHRAIAAIEGVEHGFVITEPLGTKPKKVVFRQLGYTEQPDRGTGPATHEWLAENLPEDTIISHASHGVGRTAGRLALGDLPKDSINQMGEQALEALETLQHDTKDIPWCLQPTSMGHPVAVKMLIKNLDTGKPVDVSEVVEFMPCRVPARRVIPDIVFKFGPKLGIDIIREIANMPLAEQPDAIFTLLQNLPHPRDYLAVGKQALSLSRGVDLEEVDEVVGHYPTCDLVGTEDPACDQYTTLELAAKHPSMRIEWFEGRGHGMFVNFKEAASNIGKAIATKVVDSKA